MMYMRYLTSAEIRLNPDLYTPYLFNPDSDGPIDAVQFCIEQVESMGKEAGEEKPNHISHPAADFAPQITFKSRH